MTLEIQAYSHGNLSQERACVSWFQVCYSYLQLFLNLSSTYYYFLQMKLIVDSVVEFLHFFYQEFYL